MSDRSTRAFIRRWGAISRDLRILAGALVPNIVVFAALMLLSSVVFWLCQSYAQTDFWGMLANALRLADRQFENPQGQGTAPVILAFILPILTVVIWGEAALRVVSIYLRRAENREEWDRMVTKTFSGHIVILGLGRLGMAMFRRLIEKDPDRGFVLVDVHPDVLAETGHSGPNVCHLQMDIASPEAIQDCNCARASLVIICSGDDASNLDAAYKVLDASPNAEIWVRLFHSRLASLLDKTTWRNVHFFSPYERAADALVEHLTSEGLVGQ